MHELPSTLARGMDYSDLRVRLTTGGGYGQVFDSAQDARQHHKDHFPHVDAYIYGVGTRAKELKEFLRAQPKQN